MRQDLTTVSDEELARETQDGSLDAFEQLVYRFEHRVYAFATQFCRDATDAREVTQDTFVKAFQSIGQFDCRRAFAPWLFTIARRKCIDRYRSKPDNVEPIEPELVDQNTPLELAARREEAVDLWRLARQRLSTNQFQALWLHYAEDMQVERVARVMGKTRVHIKVLLFRARRILSRELNPSLTLSEALPDSRPGAMLTALTEQHTPL